MVYFFDLDLQRVTILALYIIRVWLYAGVGGGGGGGGY